MARDMTGIQGWTPEKQAALDSIEPTPRTTFHAECVEYLARADNDNVAAVVAEIRSWESPYADYVGPLTDDDPGEEG